VLAVKKQMKCPRSYHSLIFRIESGYGFADNISSGCSLSTCSQRHPSISMMNILPNETHILNSLWKLRTFLISPVLFARVTVGLLSRVTAYCWHRFFAIPDGDKIPTTADSYWV